MKIPTAVRKFLRKFVKPQSSNIVRRNLKEPYILQLPAELLQEIMSLVWASATNDSEQVNLMNCLPLVCKAIAMAFHHASPQDIRALSELRRWTPIRYPSTPHHLKRLTVTGILSRINIARLWESLFEVEELVVNGEVLPVGKDVPWALNMTQACDMLHLGCRGIGWNWVNGRPSRPTDMTILEEYEHGNYRGRLPTPGKPPVKHEHRGLLDPEDSFGQIRRSKSLSHMHDSLTPNTEQMTCRMGIKRTKTIAELPMIDFPYDGITG